MLEFRTGMFEGKRYWIVGASEGLGRSLAMALDKSGARLVLSARNAERLRDLAATLTDATPVAMDVTDAASVAAAAAQAGDCDGVIYSVGLYEPMAAAAWDTAAIEAIVDANFTGAVRVLGQTLPSFIARNDGHIVLIGSLSGFRGLPGALGYGASKSALMHLAENLFADLSATGVKIQLMNPGFIKTRLTAKNEFAMPYIMTPDDAAALVLRAMAGTRFQTSFPRPFSWLFTLGRFLPPHVFVRLFK